MRSLRQVSLLPAVLAALLVAGSATSGPIPDGMPRVQVRFAGPEGMKVWFLAATGRFEKDPRVEAPGRINLRPGCVYRLKLGDIPGRAGLSLYPTLEIGRFNHQTAALLAHQAVPLEFSDEDFHRVTEGQLVTKVVYWAADGQGATGGTGTVVSLDQADPVREAQRRGTVLAIVRIGNIDLESP